MGMSKSELKDAINSTIIPNGQKGITAESLNNILTEMVDAAGEGGSSGGDGGIVRVPFLFMGTSEFTKEAAQSLVEEFGAFAPDGGVKLDQQLSAMFETNAALFVKFLEDARNGNSSIAILDQTPIMNIIMEISMGSSGPGTSWVESSPILVEVYTNDFRQESDGEQFIDQSVHLTNQGGTVDVEILHTGELIYHTFSAVGESVLIPFDGASLRDEDLARNNIIANSRGVDSIAYTDGSGVVGSSDKYPVLSHNGREFVFLQGTTLKKVIVADYSGNVEVSIIGTLNAS